MYIDAQTELWSAAALTTTAVSTNCYDLGAPFTSGGQVADIGVGVPMVLAIVVGVAGLHAGTETYEFQVIGATASDLTTGQVVYATTGTIATADVAARLAAGAFIQVPIPAGVISTRYLGAKIVSANSAGVTVTAWIAPANMVEEKKRYYSIASKTAA